jgi:hypothetical protein
VSCKCVHLKSIRHEPHKIAWRLQNWRVRDRCCNHSRFAPGGYAASDYSAVFCVRCGGVWRTKAGYVATLRDGTDGEYFKSGRGS